MTDVDEYQRPEPPPAADEVATLLGFLDFLRATLVWKAAGLDSAALQATTARSTMTLGGILKHVSWVEDYWFSQRLHGHAAAAPWDTVDWKADPDWEWHSAATNSPEELMKLWLESVERSRAKFDEALTDGGMSHPAAVPWPDGRSPSLRWIVTHMIEEYARHCGHADLLRESIDGSTGE